jgi:hypothetical protein
MSGEVKDEESEPASCLGGQRRECKREPREGVMRGGVGQEIEMGQTSRK